MSEQILTTGILVVGICRGSRVESIRTADGPRDRYLLGIEVGALDAWGIQKSEIIEIRLSESTVRGGAATRAQSLSGHRVAVPVWIQSWAGKRGVNYSLMMSNGSQIAELD